MARMRTLKPGFFQNEVLAECDPLARILFAGLWTEADREGRMEDRPRRLKISILPYDECDMDYLLDQLQSKGFIIRYEVQRVRYIQVLNFLKHQQPHHKEVVSKIPPPPSLEGIQSSDESTLTQARANVDSMLNQAQPDIDSSLRQSQPNVEPSLIQAQLNEIASCPTGTCTCTGACTGTGVGERTHARAKDEQIRSQFPEGLIENRAVQLLWLRFRPEQPPPIGVQERIAGEVTDFDRWKEVLSYWEANNYRPQSYGKMIARYLETDPSRQIAANGRGKNEFSQSNRNRRDYPSEARTGNGSDSLRSKAQIGKRPGEA
jgi:hypothetical protein